MRGMRPSVKVSTYIMYELINMSTIVLTTDTAKRSLTQNTTPFLINIISHPLLAPVTFLQTIKTERQSKKRQ